VNRNEDAMALLIGLGIYAGLGLLVCGMFALGAHRDERPCLVRAVPVRRRMTLAEQMQGDGWRWN
jgi:hypothetical protein